MQNNKTRPLHVIASEIRNDWKKVYFSAEPYLDAMSNLDNVNQNYLFDTGKSIVLYFLANASTYRGETAKRIKKELKDMCGVK